MEIKHKHMIEEMKSELHQCTGKLLGGKKKKWKETQRSCTVEMGKQLLCNSRGLPKVVVLMRS